MSQTQISDTAGTSSAPVLARIGIVIPCYNEEEVIPETSRRLRDKLAQLSAAGAISPDSRIYLVDNGSHDRTWELIEALCRDHAQFSGIKLARNRGHQNGLLAGLLTAQGDALISMDADLQDDVDQVDRMVEEYRKGAHIVYGVRRSRAEDSAFKRLTAHWFYKLMRWLGADILENHADYRLMSRRAVDALGEFGEVNLFLRGLVPLIGLRAAVVYYDRGSRFAGTSKYPLRRLMGFAIDGLTSFSVVPLRIISLLGLLISALTVVLAGWVLWVRLFTDVPTPGWASTVIPVYFIGGVQLLCLGVIGEYLGKTYQEVKARPRYTIEKTL
jgi:glycosyltransferase involved in cell wall biosynthesis